MKIINNFKLIKQLKYLHFVMFLLLVGNTSLLFAEVRLPNIFSDNMVLQQGIPVQIWGWANAGETVNVTFLNQKKSTITGKNGKWSLFLDELDYGGPFELVVNGEENTIIYSNVLVGEVWVSSGQSNMEWSLSLTENAQKEIQQSYYPRVRIFNVRKNAQSVPAENVAGTWNECEPAYTSGFSAVAYFFGTELYHNLNVPIGLIDASWGGSSIEPWIDINVLRAQDDFKPIIEEWEQCLQEYNSMDSMLQFVKEYVSSVYESNIAKRHPRANRTEIPTRITLPENRDCFSPPGGMYNGMISPIVPYKIKGVIWYQGESNVPRDHYQKLFPALIKNWRTQWGLGEFPFFFAQLAPFGGNIWQENEAARLREAQFMTYRNVPNTGMAVTMDIGDVNDIHPRNKKEVGRRLALWALADTYNLKEIVKSGPLYKSMSIENNKIRINFDFAEGGLIEQNKGSGDFEIAGEDNVFVPATCEIKNDHVLISAKTIKKPIAVRYGWGNAAQPGLFNKEGLPASPFRTDDWNFSETNR